ncbi:MULTISPECIES: MmgE/PrpD family protein [Burkholderia]|uniref:MmgE/PrpD family protein n=1 Tax=Burkholderia contaminans TaxID=488447 RepID=A0A2S5DRZ2_9BURK|nr:MULTISPECIES: MmgE/PrpD family protein [Burkholderia]EKS9794713.1 MmgE/PrpD family protein [Burkholderia cepacia]EKS9802668.1 MmgE/PrpD family protein [Burkholderia cepacia]EKS9809174.1 MmgE/PrpD family protein [Burkholderia cepacia]EKS9818035.1 MmgE/PrpD family protein [Burkholderia cepacia]EKS9824030.1 MmgE/PrpD family protein [Burkholderia cepacia]
MSTPDTLSAPAAVARPASPDGIIGALGRFAAAARADGLDRTLRVEAAARVLDLVGNSLIAHDEPVAQSVLQVARRWAGNGPATVIGAADRLPAASAALVNGTLAHAMDFDDSHMLSVLHPSASVIPAALAAAQASGASGAALLDAITIGTEICIRLGVAAYNPQIGNSVFFERGQHATSICGTVGAAAAAAMLFGLDAAQIAAALGIAASMGAGLLEANRTGGSVKRIHCGWAAHAGVSAAELAGAGVTAPPTALEGRFGFFRAWCGELADVDAVLRELGVDWETSRIIFKPYPCNHFTHPGIDAALQLKAQGVTADDVVSAELRVAASTLRTIGEPAALKANPPDGYAAAFSGPYTVAAALLGGGGLGVWFDDFDDKLVRDPARRALAAKVRCIGDPWCDERFPHFLPAVLRVELRDGQVREARVESSKGTNARPLTEQELVAKFVLAASSTIGLPRALELRDAVQALADDAPLGGLAALTSGPHANPKGGDPS